MKLRNVGLLALMLAATAACKKSEQRTKPGVAPVTQPGSAVAADPWAKPDEKRDPLTKPLFWSIEKDGKTSYILGTMHMGVDPNARLPDIVWKKLDEAKVFAMEADLAGAAKLDVLRKDGTTLRDELGPAYWKKLEDALGEQEAARLIGFKPMIPATLISMRGLPHTSPMDTVLHGRAINQKKKIVFLEAIEHQGAILDKWMNARMLKDLLDDVPGVEQRSKDMLAAYIAGDEGRIIAIANDELKRWLEKGRSQKEYDEMMEELLFKRNASWIEPIEKAHAEGPVFFAMGALHASGPRSVLDLLQKRGFKVTRITP
jgi:uncharacterized protein